MDARPSRFAAVVVNRPGGVEALELTTLTRRPLGATQVRVRVEAVGANPVDAGNRADPSWAGISPPYVVGYECSGTVIEVGDVVDAFRDGEAVWVLLPVRGTRWGTYAKELIVDVGFVAPRPLSISAIEAAALPLAGSTALQLLDRLEPIAGEWALVHGAAGGVGHLLVQLLRALGARIVAVASPERHELLRSLGVEIVVDRFRDDSLELAREAAGGDFTIVADLVGDGRLAASLPLLAEGGRAGSIVDLAGDLEEAVDRNITLHGVLMRPNRDDLDRLARLVLDGSLAPLVDEVFPLEDCRLAHTRLESGHGQGKLVLAVAD